jgi:[ribosomal protein S5]-alanine N-acetyltransferase
VKTPLPQTSLETERLLLRPFTLADAPAVQSLAGAVEIASTTLHVPYPYEDGMAETWILTLAPGYAAGTQATFAVTERAGGLLVGAVGLVIEPAHARAELGYWIGGPYWGHGYATEAAHAILELGFGRMGLNRIQATYITRNPASGRVMQKLGMRPEGVLRQHVLKWGVFEDLAVYGILAAEWRGSI